MIIRACVTLSNCNFKIKIKIFFQGKNVRISVILSFFFFRRNKKMFRYKISRKMLV